MGNGISAVEVKVMRGKLRVVALGRTPRGRKFIKDWEDLSATRTADPNFKAELATAVDKLFERAAPDTP